MTMLLDDLRYALRMLARRWDLTAVSVTVLGVALGVTITVFALVYAVLLQPLPYRAPDRLVRIGFLANAGASDVVTAASVPKFLRIREDQRSFSAVAADYQDTMTLSGGLQPEQVIVGRVTPDFFDVLGLVPVLGRTFAAEEEQVGRVALVTDAAWRSRFGEAPDVVGRPVRLEGEVYTLVGVIPALPVSDAGGAEFYIPDPLQLSGADPAVLQRGVSFLRLTARLRDGVTAEAAERELEVLAARYRAAFPANADALWLPQVVSIRENIRGPFRPALLTLAAAAVLVLLIGCANVANVLTTRFIERRREIALRGALGAGRWRVIRLFLAESTVVALSGAAAGLLLASFLLDAAPDLVAASLPLEPGSPLGAVPVLFAFGLGVTLGGIVGVYPAVQASRPAPADALREGGRTRAGSRSERRIRATLVAGQVALTLVLLASATLLLTSFLRLQRQAPGFDPHGVFTATLDIPSSRYPDPGSQSRLYQRLASDLGQAPGVTAAAVVQALPLSGAITRAPYARVGGDVVPLQDRPLGVMRSVGPGSFLALRIPLLRGRDFTDADTAESPQVAVVSAATATRLFGAEDPIGQRLILGSQGGGIPAEIVGVVGDVRSVALTSVPDVEIYRPLTQRPRPGLQLAVRTASSAEAFAADARRIVRAIDPELPLVQPGTVAQLLAGSLAPQRLLTLLTVLFATVALVLAAAGVFSVVAYVVQQRTAEIGIRIALGATRADVLRTVTAQTMAAVFAGLAVGGAGVWGATRVLASQLYEAGAVDSAPVGAVVALLTAIAAAASLIPARRAARVDPVIAMRGQ